MKIKVDEDLPASLAYLLRNAVPDVETVADEELNGTKDSDLWKIVQSEKRFLAIGNKNQAKVIYDRNRAFPIIFSFELAPACGSG